MSVISSKRSEAPISIEQAARMLRSGEKTLANLPESLRNNASLCQTAVLENPLALQHVPKSLKSREIVLLAMTFDADAAQYAPEKMRGQWEFVLRVRRAHPDAVQYLTPRGQTLLAVHKDGLHLAKLDPCDQNDSEIVSVAVKQNGLALQFASTKLRADREIVKSAIKENGLALQFASDGCKNDLEIVQGAIANHPEARLFANKRLKVFSDFELARKLSPSIRLDRLTEYLVQDQRKKPAEAEKLAKEIQAFIEPKLDELKGDEPKFYFSTKHNDLPRSIHYLPNEKLTLICFNKKKGKGDAKLGKGSYKHVHEAYDYRTGKAYARVREFSPIEESCSTRLKQVPGVVQTYATYTYQSAKSGKEKRAAIQKKIKNSNYPDNLTLAEKAETAKAFFQTVDAMHAKGITHNDLFSRNILFDQNKRPVIIDFGEARLFDSPVKEPVPESTSHLFLTDLFGEEETKALALQIAKQEITLPEVIEKIDGAIAKLEPTS